MLQKTLKKLITWDPWDSYDSRLHPRDHWAISLKKLCKEFKNYLRIKKIRKILSYFDKRNSYFSGQLFLWNNFRECFGFKTALLDLNSWIFCNKENVLALLKSCSLNKYIEKKLRASASRKQFYSKRISLYYIFNVKYCAEQIRSFKIPPSVA